MENLHISKSSLQEWFHQMVKKEMHIFAPVHSGDKVDFKRVTSYDEVPSRLNALRSRKQKFCSLIRKTGKKLLCRKRIFMPFPKRFSGKSVLVMQQGLHPFPAFLIGIIKINYTMPDGRK